MQDALLIKQVTSDTGHCSQLQLGSSDTEILFQGSHKNRELWNSPEGNWLYLEHSVGKFKPKDALETLEIFVVSNQEASSFMRTH